MISDCSGDNKMLELVTSYIRGQNASIVVFDITNRNSYDSISKWTQLIKVQNPNITTVVVLGNKCDLYEQREVSKEEALQFCKDNNYMYAECSALNGGGIVEMIYSLASNLINQSEIQKAINKNNNSLSLYKRLIEDNIY